MWHIGSRFCSFMKDFVPPSAMRAGWKMLLLTRIATQPPGLHGSTTATFPSQSDGRVSTRQRHSKCGNMSAKYTEDPSEKDKKPILYVAPEVYPGSQRLHSIFLDNKEHILIRPATVLDRDLFAQGIERLSVRSRYFRFYSGLEKAPPRLLNRLTAIDGRSHLSWGALHSGTLSQSPVGAVHVVRYGEESHCAELAFGVADTHHRKGIASLLLALVFLDCRELGIQALHANVLYENIPAQRLANSLNAKVVGTFEFGEIHELDVQKALTALAEKGRPSAIIPLIGK